MFLLMLLMGKKKFFFFNSLCKFISRKKTNGKKKVFDSIANTSCHLIRRKWNYNNTLFLYTTLQIWSFNLLYKISCTDIFTAEFILLKKDKHELAEGECDADLRVYHEPHNLLNKIDFVTEILDTMQTLGWDPYQVQ